MVILKESSEGDIKSGPIIDNDADDDDADDNNITLSTAIKRSYKRNAMSSFHNPINTLTASPTLSDDVFSNSALTAVQKPSPPIMDPQNLNHAMKKQNQTATILNKKQRPSCDVFSLSQHTSRESPLKRSKSFSHCNPSNNDSSSLVAQSLMYPDTPSDLKTHESVGVDGSGSISAKAGVDYPVHSFKLGQLCILRNDCVELKLVAEPTHHMTLYIVQSEKQAINLLLRNSTVQRVKIYQQKDIDGVQYVDFCCSCSSDYFESLQLTQKFVRPIIRMGFAVMAPSLESSIRRLFDSVSSEKSLSEYVACSRIQTSLFVNDITTFSFADRRQSARLQEHDYGGSEAFKRSRLSSSSSSSSYYSSSRSKASPNELHSSGKNDSNASVDKDKAIPLFVYPEFGVGAITITTADTPRLESGMFVNDSLVDFDLRFQCEHLDDMIRSKVHLFSSFFYKRLTEGGQTGMRKWTDGVDIFSKDFLIIPICEHLHWYLAIICYPHTLVTDHGEVMVGADVNTCYILIFDSLRRHRPGTLAKIKSYLVDEALDKLNKVVCQNQCQGVNVKCPQQANYTDCGLFCCQYVESFLQNPYAAVSRAIVHDLIDWFPIQLAQDRRQRLKELIVQIASTSSYQLPNEQHNSSDIEEIICLN